MFTGIIEAVGAVKSVSRDTGNLVFDVETGFDDLGLGDSIAVNGVCLTVTEFDAGGYARFFVSAESLDRSNLGQLQAGSKINLERAVKAETRLSGHLVQGHVDGKARLRGITPEDGAYLLEIEMEPELGRYCVEKGSIALNGISLTINTLSRATPDAPVVLGFTIIPHTWEHTNLHAAHPGDIINVETDVIAKYVERLCQPYQQR